MNRKFLMLLAVMPFVGMPSAKAIVYHYDVDFKIGSDTVTGMITTDKDSGRFIPSRDILSYSFLLNGGNGFSGTGADIDFNGGPIMATPTTLSFVATAGHIEFFPTNNLGGSTELFMEDLSSSSHPPQLNYIYQGITLASASTPAPYQIAAISAVPLPAALPLFAGGLGVMGFLARRRKRAAAAAA